MISVDVKHHVYLLSCLKSPTTEVEGVQQRVMIPHFAILLIVHNYSQQVHIHGPASATQARSKTADRMMVMTTICRTLICPFCNSILITLTPSPTTTSHHHHHHRHNHHHHHPTNPKQENMSWVSSVGDSWIKYGEWGWWWGYMYYCIGWDERLCDS